MPKVVINLSNRADRIVNIVMVQEGLRERSEAIERIIEAYEEYLLEPCLQPALVAEVERSRKGRFHKVKDLSEILD